MNPPENPTAPSRRPAKNGHWVVIAMILFGVAFGLALSFSVRKVTRDMKTSVEASRATQGLTEDGPQSGDGTRSSAPSGEENAPEPDQREPTNGAVPRAPTGS